MLVQLQEGKYSLSDGNISIRIHIEEARQINVYDSNGPLGLIG